MMTAVVVSLSGKRDALNNFPDQGDFCGKHKRTLVTTVVCRLVSCGRVIASHSAHKGFIQSCPVHER